MFRRMLSAAVRWESLEAARVDESHTSPPFVCMGDGYVGAKMCASAKGIQRVAKPNFSQGLTQARAAG